MRRSARRWIYCTGALAAAAVVALGQGTIALAAHTTSADNGAVAARATVYDPPTKPLYFGEKGPAVRSVQRRLAQLHYYAGPIDGVFGDDMLEAAWAFREVQGLRVSVRTEAEPITTAFLAALVQPR
jgi:peptidoglycan hydrolase-like protein with peptidoglycan-binding domain